MDASGKAIDPNLDGDVQSKDTARESTSSSAGMQSNYKKIIQKVRSSREIQRPEVQCARGLSETFLLILILDSTVFC